MVRFKFLVFAVIVIGAWVAQFVLTSPAQSQSAVSEGLEKARLQAIAALSQRDAAALQLAGSIASAVSAPDALVVSRAGGAKTSASDRLTQLRTNVAKLLPAATDTAPDFFAFVDSESHAWARGAGTEVQTGSYFSQEDLLKLVQQGAQPRSLVLQGKAHLLMAFPVTERGSSESVGTFVVARPLALEAMFSGVTSPIALLSPENALVAVGGIQGSDGEAKVKQWLATLGTGSEGVVEQGGVDALGPVALPFFTSGDAMGGKAPLRVAKKLQQESIQIVAFASVEAPQTALAAAQKKSLLALLGLSVVSLVWMVLMGSGAAKSAKQSVSEDEDSPREPAETPVAKRELAPPAEEPETSPSAESVTPEASPDDFPFGAPAAPESAPALTAEPAAEASPDDFPFPSAPAPEQESAADPFGAFAPVPQPPPAPVSDPFPFGQPSAPASAAMQEDDNPDATRVAAVPAELLRAAAQVGADHEVATARRAVGAELMNPSALPAADGNPDDSHFQDVFREFISTRERCGESPDGLTYDKFAAKLRKNKDQLIAKHNCRTVRFQVYVKEGKAALKATPIAR